MDEGAAPSSSSSTYETRDRFGWDDMVSEGFLLSGMWDMVCIPGCCCCRESSGTVTEDDFLGSTTGAWATLYSILRTGEELRTFEELKNISDTFSRVFICTSTAKDANAGDHEGTTTPTAR